jgi:hypothetical protein
MYRILSLMVALAHVGVASIPCVEVEIVSAQPAAIGGRATHSMPAEAAQESAHAGGHASHRHPAEHAQAVQDRHAAHASHAVADAPSNAEVTPRVAAAAHELRAPCLCGCSQRSNSASTTTPQPPSFAPFPPEPPRLVAAIPTVDERAPGPWPVSPVDPPEHVPIAS